MRVVWVGQMKILWICGSKIVGGAERVTIQVLGLLRERLHSVGALLPATSPVNGAVEGLAAAIHTARLGGSRDWLSIAAITRAVRAFGPQVVLVTTPSEWLWSCVVPRGVLGAPLVLARHMMLRLPTQVRRLANLRADAVIAVSESVRANLLRRPGIRADLIRVIRNPVRFKVQDEILPGQARAGLRKSMGLPEPGRWIGFFGGNDPQKGIGDLMAAARRIRSQGLDLNLLVCGRPHRKPGRTVAEWAAEAGLGPYTHYLAEVEEMERALRAVDAVVIATHSSLGEGLPLTALEAMACGTPVVGYSAGGIREAIGAHEQGGLLAKPDDPADLARVLQRVFSERELGARVARRALEWARAQFDPARAADEYERLFQSLTGS
jgi:glycosyltransferase involved in cell wall biosynthesis